MLHKERSFAYVHTGEEKLQILSKLIQIRLNQGKPPEDFACRKEGENQKDKTSR